MTLIFNWFTRRIGGYERTITIPSEWAGRRITVQVECLNSFGTVYVDGKKAGDIRFPGGDADLTSHCRPGASEDRFNR